MAQSKTQFLPSEKVFSEATASLLVLLVGALWGTIGIVAKDLLNANYHPVMLVTWRMVLAGLFGQLVMACVNRRFTRPTLPVWFLLHGFIGSVLTMVLYFTAVDMVGVALTVSLHYSWPSFSVVLGRIFFKEEITAKKVAALGVITVGIVLLSITGAGVANISPFGIIAAIFSGLTLASSGAFSKYELQFVSQLEVIVWPITLASVPLALFSWSQGYLSQGFTSPYHFLSILYLAVVTTFLTNSLYTVALKSLQVGSASMLATIEPVAGVIFAAILFQEHLSVAQRVGLACVILGVILVNYRRKKKLVPVMK